MNYLEPEILAKVRNLELQARQVVDGYVSGMHRSQQHGFAVEFAQHREYAPGDDIRHIDWKVFGRTERFYLKQYELETNLVCWLLIDASDSMRYASGSISKYDYAAIAAASLAYLVVQQSDSVGLATFDDQVRQFLRASGQPSQLKDLTRLLAAGPTAEKSCIGAVLHEAAERFNRRGVVIVFSDLLDDVPALLAGLQHLRYERHEVVVFHVLDPAEVEFPFRQSTLFRGLEAWPNLLTDPVRVRANYLNELRTFLEEVRRGCRSQNIDYVRLSTDQALGPALVNYLALRAARG
jgi:uncharacterized protein (DUF58 family)